jgi:SAM-dependent methyltransferase
MSTCIKELLILVTITPLVISACKPDGDAGSMQPVEGYPFTTNMEEIKDILKYRGLDTISFRSGEIIADIGAGNGYIEAMLSMFHDSLTFYVQDIDASVCNKEAIDEVVDFYQKVNGRPFTNRFIVVNGTDRDTNLPDSTFDRILMIWTYAYLREPHVFIGDVRDNLKVNGLLYVINPTQDEDAYTNSIRQKYGWNASPLEKQITDIIDCGFELVRITRNYNSDGFNQPYFMVFRKKNDPGLR